MEGDLLGLNFSIFNVDLVSYQDNRNILTNSDEIFVPLGHVLVGNSRADIKHNDSTVSSDVVSVSESSKFLLSGGVPNVELNESFVGVERHGVDLDSEGGNIFLLKLTSEMSLDKGGLSSSTVSNEDKFILSNSLLLGFHCLK